MKKQHVIFGLFFLFLISFNACRNVEDDFLPDNDFSNELVDGNEDLDDNWDDFDDDLSDDQSGHDHDHAGEVDNTLTSYRVSGNSIIKIKDHEVANQFLSLQQNTLLHEDIWNLFAKLIPEFNRRFVKTFQIVHGGGDLAGFVNPIDDDISQWNLGMAIDLVDQQQALEDQEDFVYTLIHEYGHILTLNSEQLNQNTDEHSCNNYFPGEGCSNTNSYFNQFYQKYWKDIYGEFQTIQTDDQLNDFYNKYQNRFVSDYAATNPGEDIAESFSVFVTENNQRTGNTMADQKVNFFYGFSELVTLRSYIRESGITLPAPLSWTPRKHKKKSLVISQ